MSDEMPDFVTPIRTGGEEGPPFELPTDVVRDLERQLAEMREARARAMVRAHEVVIWS